jgi:hypothetical protein
MGDNRVCNPGGGVFLLFNSGGTSPRGRKKMFDADRGYSISDVGVLFLKIGLVFCSLPRSGGFGFVASSLRTVLSRRASARLVEASLFCHSTTLDCRKGGLQAGTRV